MGVFSTGFGTGFEIGLIIKEKKRAKKAAEDMKLALEEWRLSGKEPSYTDKLMMALTATQVGQSYSKIFNDITNDKASYDKEKMSQDAIKLREYTNQVMNLNKQIQTAAKDNTLDLFPWDSFGELFPDLNLKEVLNNIPAIQKQRLEAQTRKESIDIYGKTPTDVRQGVGEQLGVIPEGIEPRVEPPEEPSVANYNSAASYLSKFVNANPDTFNKIKSGLQSKTGIDLSNITQESLKKPEKAAVGGGDRTTSLPQLEKYRTNIKEADTLEEAHRLYNSYAKEYDEADLEIENVDKYWAQGQTAYLDNIKQAIDNLLVDRGDKGRWLKPGTVTKEEVGLDFKGEQKAEEVYEMLRKEYKKYRDTLAKMGVDVSMYPELLTLSEIEKVGGVEGFWAIKGVKKGQYKSIYK